MLRAKHPITIKPIRWLTVILLILTHLFVHQAQAQVSSQKGWFTVDFDAGCLPLNVTLTNTGVRSGSLFVDFMGDGSDPFSNTGFTSTFDPTETLTTIYTTAGTFLIRVVDQSGAGAIEDRFDFIEINVFEAVAPTFTATLCNNNQVVLNFDFGLDNYDFYEIDFGDGSPTVIFDKSGSSETNFLYATQGSYNIQVSGKLTSGSDVSCGISPQLTVNTLHSIPTPEVTGLTLLDEQTLELSYASLTDNITYRLLLSVNGSAFTPVADIDPIANPDNFTHMLGTATANTADLQFQIGAYEACGVVENFSNIIRNVRTEYTASYLNINQFTLTTTWETSHISTEIQSVSLFFDGTEEMVTTAASGENDKELASCLDLSPYYYQVNLNGAFSRSLTIVPDLSTRTLTPPVLSGLTGRLAGSAVILSYDQAPVSAAEYRIFTVGTSGPELIGTTSSFNFTANDFNLTGSEVCFVVSYVDDCGFESPKSEEICFEFTPTLILPNAFSPNGDMQNDTFGVPIGVYPDFQMQIFNRWGKLIYLSRDANQAWNGAFNGQPVQAGKYVYRINYNFTPNSPVSLTGSITLIR